MRPHLSRLSRLLRTSVLALLVLGLMIKSVLAQLSELHAAEHAMAVTADAHGHGHGFAGDSDEGLILILGGHTIGAHGLMHQSDGSTTLTGLVLSMSVPMVYVRMPDLPIPDTIGVPHEVPSSPFRPPIA